jgi:hypothetical protein
MPRAERHYTIPTAMLSTDISGAMRIDHILANRGVRVEKAWVMRDGEADVASISMERRLTFRSLILTTVAALAMMPTGSY